MKRWGGVWVVVLAGGAGTRLHALTSTMSGLPVPKQFCRFDGRRSMLGVTLARARAIAPAERTVAVVLAEHRIWWERELEASEGVQALVEARNRGTARALLHALLHVHAQDPGACVVVMPADHLVDDEGVLADALQDAVVEARRWESRAIVLGAVSTTPDSSLGWILAGRAAGRTHAVEEFIEKPNPILALDCVRRGAYRNTALLAAKVAGLLETYAFVLPGGLADLRAEEARRQAGMRVAQDPMDLRALDLSRDVLQRLPLRLRLLVLPECGWTDVGTLDRLAEWWRRHPGALREVRHGGLMPLPSA